MSLIPQSTGSALPIDLDRGPRRAARWLVGSLAAFLAVVLVWMNFASLDISVHALGAVVPSSRVQHIQSLEGGIIRELAVREGQKVRKGDLLAYVENLQYNAELGEGQKNYLAHQAAMARLDAELSGKPLEFSADLQAQAPELVAEQRKLWQSRVQERDSALESVRQQIQQRTQELADARSRVSSQTQLLALAQETLAMEEKLMAQGASARADYLHAQQAVTQIQSDLQSARLAVPRLQAALQEGNAHLREVGSKFRGDASRERSELEAKAAALGEQLVAHKDRVSRRELRSPMDGIVNRLIINTVGGVAKAGETIMELVPERDTLVIAGKVKPNEIAFIHAGQVATVRITAYDSSIFGSLDGKVVRVGADALSDEKQQTYFEVYLETDRNYLGKPEERLTISPGMMADASIHTGKRTLMEYVLKPVVKTLDKSLRER